MSNEVTFKELQIGERFTIGESTVFKKTGVWDGQRCDGDKRIFTFGLLKPVIRFQDDQLKEKAK